MLYPRACAQQLDRGYAHVHGPSIWHRIRIVLPSNYWGTSRTHVPQKKVQIIKSINLGSRMFILEVTRVQVR